MKKLIYTILICILTLNISTNVCNAQRLITTIKTPKGYTVPDTYDYSLPPLIKMDNDSMKTDMSINEISAIQKYAAATYTATLISGPTILYNCHSFAWNKSEQGPNCWIGKETKTAEDIYWNPTQGGYIEVPTQGEASKINYYLTQTNHSAINTNTFDLVRSKWGQGGLYEHSIGDGPYVGMDTRKYYKFIVGISPENNSCPCYSQTKTFTTPTILAGATYSWTCANNLTPVSGQNTTTYTVQVNTTGGEQSWVRLEITHQKYSGNSADISKVASADYYFNIGTPQITNQKVDNNSYYYGYQICPGSHALTVTPVGGNAGSATWIVPAGISYFVGNNELDFTFPSNLGSIAFSVRSTNSCGIGSYYSFYLAKKYYGCPTSLSMTIYPNPASDNITVTINDDPSLVSVDNTELSNVKLNNAQAIESNNYTIKIYNSQSALLSTITRSGRNFNVPLSNMRDGNYILDVSDGKNSYRQQFIVKHN